MASETPHLKGCRAHPCRKRGIINPSNDQTQNSIAAAAERSVGSHRARSGHFCSVPSWTEPEQLEVLWKDFYTCFQKPLLKVTFSSCCSWAEEGIGGTNARHNPKEGAGGDSLQSY